ncbi:MAG TPA: TonB-dependent receptor [Povalibacter sp.]|uniref:TonB-dependent receptor domain-containing protein n=1 Tax=Povalibacter sp. TaxID=1962978 RepID=UPI002C92B48E|nr:TonB-dependent receptor [Povalibacter sp.]HMN45033.1 TonB-dependent receptor [Povalibacter sp.]
MSRHQPFAAVALACAVPFTTIAASPDPVSEVIVTAARIEQPIADVIGSVTVLTHDDIQRRQVQSVQDLLRGEAGIAIANNGGLGKLSSMFIRGTEADHVLVLVNGVRVGSTTAGTTRFEYIPVDQIERVEIVRGPRSSLYGADAIGGVVQIFTRDADGPSVSIGGGSHETYDASASFGLKGENAWLAVSGNYLETQGYNACQPSPTGPFGYTGGCFTDEPDDDGYRNTSGVLRTGYRWGETAEVEASVLYASGHTEYDGSWTNETDFTEAVYALKGKVAATSSWDLTLQLGLAQDDSDDFSDGTYRSTIDTERRNAGLQSDWTVAAGQVLTLGVDWLDDRVDSTTPYDETSRTNTGVFGQYADRFGDHEVLASVRNDDNEQFGTHTTGGLGWKWFAEDYLAFSVAWGTAFLAPSFNDLYYPGFSNPDLAPEESDSVELGISGTAANTTWSLSAFETNVDDLIAFDSATSSPQNINEARIRGVEAQARTQLDRWSVGLTYTHLDPRNQETHKLLPRRPEDAGRIDVSYGTNAFSLGATVNLVGSRYDDVGNTLELDRYSTVDFVGRVHFGSWFVQGRIANAFDEDYETAAYYYQDGRSYFLTLGYQPQ